ncbi:hypothetical protein [Actinospongicola halichondriae]|uniref:hypothetical protein n=1 Tax=Actinospongicola halichondriae TaxID=3236844 RepID=UPI003D496BF2
MKPLHAVAGGALLIGLDFRTTSLDLLPDLVGWLLIVWAATRLATPLLTTVAVVGAVASLGTLSLPYHYVQFDPFAERMVVVTPDRDLGYAQLLEFDPVTGWRLGAFALSTAALGVTVLVLAGHLRDRRRGFAGTEVDRSMRQISIASWAVVVCWVAPRLVSAGLSTDDGYAPVWDDPASKIALLGAATIITYTVVVGRDAREPWARRLTRQVPPPQLVHDEAVADE